MRQILFTMSSTIKTYEIQVDEAEIKKLHALLERTVKRLDNVNAYSSMQYDCCKKR